MVDCDACRGACTVVCTEKLIRVAELRESAAEVMIPQLWLLLVILASPIHQSGESNVLNVDRFGDLRRKTFN